MLSKVCARCRVDLSVDNFRQEKRVVNGLTSWCRGCEKEYRAENKEKQAAYCKDYYLTNIIHIKEKSKEYNEINRDKNIERAKEYYKSNKDKIKEYNLLNKDRKRETQRLHRERNRQKYSDYMLKYNAMYRAKT